MSELKIAKIDVFQLDLPYSGGVYVLSGGREYRSFDSTIVRITTNTGLEGWGESVPFGSTYIAAHGRGARAGIEEIAPKLIGLDPRHVDRINDVMDEALVGHEHAKSAIDIACWDVFGKSVGLPVCDLLGGRTNVKLPLISSIYVGEPEDMRKRVDEHRKMGYMGHSVKIAGEPVTDAARIIASLADKQPGELFIVDANGGMTAEIAVRMLRLLPDGLDFVLEAPCSTWRESLSVRRRTNVAMHLDELILQNSSIVQLIADDAAEGVSFKISKQGGLTKCRQQRDICQAAGLTFSVQDCVGSDIAFAAIVHLGQSVNGKYLRCVLGAHHMTTIKTADGPYEIKDGSITAPNLPGLGITPRLEVLGEPVASYV